MRPLVATPELIEPRENRYVDIPELVAIMRQPRLSGPTEYELPAELMVTFVCTPALLLMSSTPTRRAILPVPSASKAPAIAAGPLVSKPWNKKAYWPWNTDSLPAPQREMVIVADADLVVSATEVAVRVTVEGVGTVAGAR